MITITNHPGNTNQNHKEISPRIPVRMAITQKTTNNKYCQGYGGKEILAHCWWECKLVQTLWQTVQRYLKKLKIELPHDPAIPFLGIYPKKTETLI